MLAWTQTEHVFGKQAWLGALDGTALGREIHQEITEGTRPPFPLTPSTVLAGDEVVPPCDVGPQGAAPGPPGPAQAPAPHRCGWWPGPASGCPGSGASCARSGSSVLNLDPLADALRHGSEDGIRAVDPALIARPGLQLRLAVTALRAGVLRYVTEDGTLVESDARTPAPAESAGPVDLVDGAIASASVPMVFPPAPDGRRRLRRRRRDRDRPGRAPPPRSGRPASSPWWPCRSGSPRDERDYAAAPAGYIGLRSMGMIGVAERQIANLNVHLPEGTTLTTIDPVVDVVGLFEIEPGLLRINKDYGWLRAADLLADGDAGIAGRHRRRHPRHRRGPPRGLAPRGVALGRTGAIGDGDAGDARPRARAQGDGPRPGRPAQAARLPGARRLRGLVDRLRGPHGRAPAGPARPSSPRRDGRAAADGSLRPSGRPASPAGGTARQRNTAVDELEPDRRGPRRSTSA